MTYPKLSLVVAASLLGLAIAGCFGSDPNKNSMYLPGLTGAGGTSPSGNGGSGGGTTVGPLVGTALATFDTDRQAYVFSMFSETGNLAVNNNGTAPTITWDSSDGSPSGGGSLKVTAPYSGANQYVDVQSPSYPMTSLQNFQHGKLHVRVKVDPGSTFSGQIEPYVDTTTGFVFVGTSLNAMHGNDWADYVVDLDAAMTKNSGFDLTKVILIGVHIGSGGAGTSATAVTFHIDSFTIEGGMPSVTGTGGSGGSGGSGGAGGSGDASAGDAASDSATD